MRQAIHQARKHAQDQKKPPNTGGGKKPPYSRSSRIIRVAAALLFATTVGISTSQMLMHPDTPIPRQWNPVQPLRIGDPVTLLTGWKLERAAEDGGLCAAILSEAAQSRRMDDLVSGQQCHIRDRVRLDRVGDATLRPLETRCAIGLRLAMWEKHSLQPAAMEFLGSAVTQIDHIGSYNCRAMRATSGTGARMSSHATAKAIDISGFRLADGNRVRLLSDWDGDATKAAFLRAVRDGACDWFNLTLSPDFNSLHADHFHLQSTGWGSCN